ncbi:MAG: acyl-CoA synthetase FdrA [Anaerolineales bacterium]|nr:acyl-CoA synthetase FdrA [Anaerolineales bacterium]
MSSIKTEIRSGAYYDSVILMQLQRSLADLPTVIDAGVVMGTEANKDLLEQSGLLVDEIKGANADDLVIVVKAENEKKAQKALEQVDDLVAARRSRDAVDQEFLPKSQESAAKTLPDAKWTLISVPGRYAAGVSREALRLGTHVFLYSDNVSLEEEIALKKKGAEKGLLVMGPDCGTAIINGIGLGFANQVRKGSIGMVAASGTGLQQVSVRIHQLGRGLTHALGTGGRDLTSQVGGLTARMSLELLDRDPETKVIVLVSKPPDPEAADGMINFARGLSKPVVINFIGYASTLQQIDNLYFTTTFDDTAAAAVKLADDSKLTQEEEDLHLDQFNSGQKYLRGLFSGGTLAYEALLILDYYLPTVYSNVPINKEYRLKNSLVSQGHTIVDLGEDEFTVGRLHPMMDHELRIRRLEAESEDPETALILLDIVLGYGSHPDPAAELVPAIKTARSKAKKAGRYLEVVTVISGTDADPQDMKSQEEQFLGAGARVFHSNDAAARFVGRLVRTLEGKEAQENSESFKPVDLESLTGEFSAINVGLESFTESLLAQNVEAVQVDWKPAAGGDPDLMALLEKMKG